MAEVPTLAAGVRSAQVVEIERLGFKHKLMPQFDLSRLSTQRRVQVREKGHYAPSTEVDAYVQHMGQSEFPPIVITTDDWIVDGNTRIGASLKRKQKFFPAIVLDIRWEGAPEARQHELRALAATLNNANGRRLTSKEAKIVVADLVTLGWKMEQIARAIGAKPGEVSIVKQEIDAVARLRRVGLTNGKVHDLGPSLRALGKSPAIQLNDEPFRQLALLSIEAGLNASEIRQMALDIRETGSDVSGLQKLAQLRQEMVDRIRQKSLTGQGKPPVARQLRQHLGFITKFAENPAALVETNQVVSDQHVAVIQATIDLLVKVLAAQGEREDDASNERNN